MPGKSHREGISIIDLVAMIPDEKAATRWFESILWKSGRACPKCGSTDTRECKGQKPMPYFCRDCKSYFSIRTGTPMERSHIPLKKWAWGIYLWTTSLKGVSSMKLHRDLGISQKSAWFMAHRLRETFIEADIQFDGPVEVDETYMGGKRRNMHRAKRKEFDGRGPAGKTPVVGMKDRETNQVSAKVMGHVDGANLQRFVVEHIHGDTMVYTDDAAAYKAFPHHESVKHSVGEYVRDQAHTNGIESFWATLKRAHTGTFHRLSRKHLQRYVNEFAGRHNLRPFDTIDQMREIVAGMVGKRLLRKQLCR